MQTSASARNAPIGQGRLDNVLVRSESASQSLRSNLILLFFFFFSVLFLGTAIFSGLVSPPSRARA